MSGQFLLSLKLGVILLSHTKKFLKIIVNIRVL
jgi:hypothetical protein